MSHQYRADIIFTLLPVALLLGSAAIIGAIGALRRGTHPGWYRAIAVVGLLGASAAGLNALYRMRFSPNFVGIDTMAGGILGDRFAVFAECAACGLAVLVILGASLGWVALHGRRAAFHSLVLTAAAAIALMANTREMAALLAAATLLVVALVGLAALTKADGRSIEATLKQLVLLGVALGLLAEGLAIIYGLTGSTDLARSRVAYGGGAAGEGLGLALCLLGAAGLLGAAPLHRWVVNAAEGLAPVTGAAVIGLGGFGGAVLLTRLTVSGFGPALRPWLSLATVVAAVATLAPALLALRVTDVRRLIGLLASLQAGLLLVAVLGSGPGGDHTPAAGATALLMGAVVFAVAAIGSMLAVGSLHVSGIASEIDSLRGLARRSPATAISLTIGLVALVGLPPLGGFLVRILIASSAVAAGYAWVALLGLLASALAAVAVIRFLVAVYVEDNEERAPLEAAPRMARIAVAACAVLGVMATLLAQPLLLLVNGASLALH
ncbi:MAG: proton-conducting transporter membrane subunit [Candidatus Dormibacteria bacterium]